MKLDVRIAPTSHGNSQEKAKKPPVVCADATRTRSRLEISFEGKRIDADVIEVATCTYSVLLGEHAYEGRVECTIGGLRIHAGTKEFRAEVTDPRVWRGRRGGAAEVEGRQEILAPMPGKVVRLLVKQGEKVEAGQGMLVVEA